MTSCHGCAGREHHWTWDSPFADVGDKARGEATMSRHGARRAALLSLTDGGFDRREIDAILTASGQWPRRRETTRGAKSPEHGPLIIDVTRGDVVSGGY